MNRFSLVCGILIGLLSNAIATAESAGDQAVKEIPLDQIWTYGMPGTRDVRELEPKRRLGALTQKEYVFGSFVNLIVAYLHNVPKAGETAESGFVVVGTGKEALKNAQATLRTRNRKEPEKFFPSNTDLTLVFFTYTCGWHARINSIEQGPGAITVKYQFVAQPVAGFAATRFALIPIGRLKPGKTDVRIVQLPPVDEKNQPAKPIENPNRYVCGSFSFDVL